MPHVITSLVNLCSERYTDFELQLNTMTGTSSFNSPRPLISPVMSGHKEEENEAQVRFSVENLRSCGLSDATLEVMCRKSSFEQFKSVRNANCVSKISVSSKKGVVLSG